MCSPDDESPLGPFFRFLDLNYNQEGNLRRHPPAGHCRSRTILLLSHNNVAPCRALVTERRVDRARLVLPSAKGVASNSVINCDRATQNETLKPQAAARGSCRSRQSVVRRSDDQRRGWRSRCRRAPAGCCSLLLTRAIKRMSNTRSPTFLKRGLRPQPTRGRHGQSCSNSPQGCSGLRPGSSLAPQLAQADKPFMRLLSGVAVRV